ncbi:branched-chain amino acid ABC transporter permease [Candidatus Izemoplasma sp. B36]|uniref:branched-chain amino acid ABC transporter permease n=1 Tax=Candidatus Izemoplasma sp. B36 TaxID=3242468 RepID=UPI0035578587
MTLNLLILLGSLILIYFLVDLIFLRKSEHRIKQRARLSNILLIIGVLGGLFITINEMTLHLFLQILFLNSVELCVLILATTGIVLIFKTSITTNFAQGSLATVGAYFAAKMIIRWTESTELEMVQIIALAILAGVVLSFIIGLFIDTVIIRNAKRVTSVGKQMITMGLVLMLIGGIPLIFGTLPLPFNALSYEVTTIPFGDKFLVMPNHNLISIIITVVVLTILFVALRVTKWGLGVRATASNEIVASMMGVNTKVITALSWAIAGGLGALAACLYAPSSAQVTVSFMTPVQVNSFLASVLGGFFTFGGPIVGAALINIFTSIASFFNSVWANVIVYTLILLLVLVKPLGLFGKKTAKKV